MQFRALLLLGAFAAAASAQPAKTITAREVIERIKQNVGVPWRAETVDTIKAGDPETPVTGIATTMMATLEVLQRAAASGKNFVITHEPTFYSHQDGTAEFERANDAVWKAKEDFIREHHMVVWRFHDHWHMRRPDGILTGVTRVLGWQNYEKERAYYVIPETTLDQLASSIKEKFHTAALRVVGDPKLKVTQVALRPGAGGEASHLSALRRDDVQVLVIGEVPEWETIEYVADASAEGRKKALILMGHIPSEQAGMEDCSQWLKGFVGEVPIEFVAAKEMFWLAK